MLADRQTHPAGPLSLSLSHRGLLQVIPWVLFYIQAEWVARAWAAQQGEEAVVLPSVEEMDAHRLEFEAALIAGGNRCGETLAFLVVRFRLSLLNNSII